MDEQIKRPDDAKPYSGTPLPTLNVLDKYKRGKRLNFQERSDFASVCKLGADQIIDCYAPSYHQEQYDDVFYFLSRCSECPYVQSKIEFLPDHVVVDIESIFDAQAIESSISDYCEWDSPKAYVYFITDGRYVKVGKATNIKTRLSDLQVSNPRPLTCIAIIPCTDIKAAHQAEHILHRRFTKYRMGGEWFDIYDGVYSKPYERDCLQITKWYSPDKVIERSKL